MQLKVYQIYVVRMNVFFKILVYNKDYVIVINFTVLRPLSSMKQKRELHL